MTVVNHIPEKEKLQRNQYIGLWMQEVRNSSRMAGMTLALCALVLAEVCSPRLTLPSSAGSAAELEIFDTFEMIKRVFLALALAPCALSQLQLVASGPGVGKVSEPLTLTCAVSGVSINTQYYYWHWIRQPPGEGLESVGRVYLYTDSTRYAPSLQGRVTISADTARNQFSLQLRSLTAADTGTYYCARGDTVTRRQGAWDKKGVSEPLTLTCAVSGVSIMSQDYIWYWVRQFPGEGPESMGGIYPYTGDTSYAPSLQGRITISADTTSNQFSLQLRSLTAADTAAYYCARGDTVTGGLGQKGGEPHASPPGEKAPDFAPAIRPLPLSLEGAALSEATRKLERRRERGSTCACEWAGERLCYRRLAVLETTNPDLRL
ncbi:uncharacterized protein LOC120380730 [Mauremys reevesii]|uniref:uncharacterized protein LOC120380730 n=1 Tax=Mauremys reevesii TaxID=260615 RepID=UPI00193EF7BA|nr:uncharacterized protein LOC120380730 [Mauremys reevesii]